MYLKKLKDLKEFLEKDYPHSESDIKMAFETIFPMFNEDTTVVVFLHKSKKIERKIMKRKEVIPNFKMPIYNQTCSASVISSRQEMPGEIKKSIKEFRLIDYVEPFIYLEE